MPSGGMVMESSSDLMSKVLEVGRDNTFRFSFRSTDLLVLFRISNLLTEDVKVVDLWGVGDGCSALITNRVEDLPAWFKLHPSEVCNTVAYRLLDQFNEGEYPCEPIEGPHIWRICAGDTLVWLGDSRPHVDSYNGVLGVYRFRECALAIGDTAEGTMESYMYFGALGDEHDSPLGVQRLRLAAKLVRSLGLPREMSTAWLLG